MVLQVQNLTHHLPHRPPMIWLDRVLAFDSHGGEAELTLKPDGLYLSDGHLRATSCMELIAQTFGYTTVAYQASTAEKELSPVTRAMLVSFRNARFASPETFQNLQPPETIFIKWSGLKTHGPIVSLKGIVKAREQILAEGNVSIFWER